MLSNKEKEIFNRLVRDLKTVDKVNKNQILKQFDFIYCRWFSAENVKEVREEFTNEINKEIYNRGGL